MNSNWHTRRFCLGRADDPADLRARRRATYRQAREIKWWARRPGRLRVKFVGTTRRYRLQECRWTPTSEREEQAFDAFKTPLPCPSGAYRIATSDRHGIACICYSVIGRIVGGGHRVRGSGTKRKACWGKQRTRRLITARTATRFSLASRLDFVLRLLPRPPLVAAHPIIPFDSSHPTRKSNSVSTHTISRAAARRAVRFLPYWFSHL